MCEILNQNWPKWLEINRFRCISVLVGFGRFSVFQREDYWERKIFFASNRDIIERQTQTLFSTQNTEQHIKNHKTQTKISNYKVSLKQTSQDDTKPMESQYKHGWFGMRETKSKTNITRWHKNPWNLSTSISDLVWDKQNQEEDIP